MNKPDESIGMDSSVTIALIKGEIESLSDDIRRLEDKKRKVRDAVNDTIAAEIVMYFELIVGEEAKIGVHAVVDWNYQINSIIKVYINQVYTVSCPYGQQCKIAIPDIEFAFYNWSGAKRYEDFLGIKDFCDTVVQHYEVFTVISQFIDEQLSAFQVQIHKLNKQISLIEDKIKECRTRIRSIRIETLLSGKRIMFYDHTGKKLHSTCKRPENYRWIEITAMSLSGKLVDIRGVIFEEKKNSNGFSVYYTFTGKEKVFERRKVRIKTLLRSID